ncbi:hypothetical protein IWW38_002940, partial [Coemansia aciculifera]
AFATVFTKSKQVSLGGVLERSEELAGSKGTEEQAVDGDHAYAEVLLSVAADLGLVDSAGKRTRAGQAAVAAIRALRAKEYNAETVSLEWACVAAAILLDQGALSSAKWSVAYEDDQSPVDARQLVYIRWLSRIAALVGGGPTATSLPLNRDVLAFSSAARLVVKAASASADAACVSRARAEPGAWKSPVLLRVRALRAEAPLECAASAARGLVVHAVLTGAAMPAVDGAQHVLSETWALSAAVLAAAEALGAKDAADDLRSARAWAKSALNRPN